MNNITKIKVVGVGGAGCNTISRLFQSKMDGVELISINTDVQDLLKKKSQRKVRIGEKITQGLGSGMDPKIGELSAQESYKKIEEELKNANIIFLTAGLGGGTGSGAMPIISQITKKSNALTIGVVTLPFSFEGKKRRNIALNSLNKLKKNIDTLVVIPNDKLLKVSDDSSVVAAFSKCDELLKEAVKSISNVILHPGIFNLDFSDIKEVLQVGGVAFFGVGKSQGKDRADKAVKSALFSPIVNFPLKSLKGVLFNIACGGECSLFEIKQIAQSIKKHTPRDAKIIFGVSSDKNLLKNQIRVTVIATSS